MEQPLKVMVIDDSRTIRRTAQMLLGEAGCEVITASDGFDALAKIVDHAPQIIFVDVLMPRRQRSAKTVHDFVLDQEKAKFSLFGFKQFRHLAE